MVLNFKISSVLSTMSQAVKKVVKYSFEKIKANIITAFLSADNGNSVTILKKWILNSKNKCYNNTTKI